MQGDNEAYTDRYQGVAFYWTHFTTQRQNTVVSWDSTQNDEKRAFQLSVLFRHRRLVRQYLEHVSVCADAEEKRNRQLLVSRLTSTMYTHAYAHPTCLLCCSAMARSMGHAFARASLASQLLLAYHHIEMYVLLY